MYQEMYTHLFNAVTDALSAIDDRNYGQVEELLKQAQQDAEERFLAAGEQVE